MENKLAKVLLKTTFIYCQKPYPKLISKANTKPVTVNIAVISAVDTHFCDGSTKGVSQMRHLLNAY
jgi:hypothetical protein